MASQRYSPAGAAHSVHMQFASWLLPWLSHVICIDMYQWLGAAFTALADCWSARYQCVAVDCFLAKQNLSHDGKDCIGWDLPCSSGDGCCSNGLLAKLKHPHLYAGGAQRKCSDDFSCSMQVNRVKRLRYGHELWLVRCCSAGASLDDEAHLHKQSFWTGTTGHLQGNALHGNVITNRA